MWCSWYCLRLPVFCRAQRLQRYAIYPHHSFTFSEVSSFFGAWFGRTCQKSPKFFSFGCSSSCRVPLAPGFAKFSYISLFRPWICSWDLLHDSERSARGSWKSFSSTRFMDSSGRFLLFWFFPDHLLGRRHNPAVEILLGVVWACKALLWLRTKHHTLQAKKVLNLLPAGERHALIHGCELQHAWSLPFLDSLVSKQQVLVNNFSADFGLYHWFSSSWRYVGIGKLWRQNHDKQGGLTS